MASGGAVCPAYAYYGISALLISEIRRPASCNRRSAPLPPVMQSRLRSSAGPERRAIDELRPLSTRQSLPVHETSISRIFAGRRPGSARLHALGLAGHLRVVGRVGHVAQAAITLVGRGHLQIGR